MGAIISVAGDHVYMSAGCAEVIRLGLVAHLRERGEDRTPLGARTIEDLERTWQADLADDQPPYDDPSVRALLAPSWLALARDVTRPQPRLLTDVEWESLDRGWRIWWTSNLLRISRAWSGVDLESELTADWSTRDRAALAVHLAETPVGRAWRRFLASPSPAHRVELESALEAQAALARSDSAARLAAIEQKHARTRHHADERERRAR